MNFLRLVPIVLILLLYSFSLGSYTIYGSGFLHPYEFIVTITALLLLVTLDCKSYFLLRCIHRLQELIKVGSIKFCNPMHGKPVYLERGSLIYKISTNENLPTSDDQETQDLNYLEDRRGKYFLTGCKINIKIIGEKGYSLNLEEEKVKQLKKYFFDVTMNNDMCAVNDEENHYMNTDDVIKMLSMGMSLVKKEKLISGYILAVDPLILEYICGSFMIGFRFAARLIKHNQLFFGVYNRDALELCLSGKMQYYKRPADVKNSQWKWYSSDFCKIASENGFNYRSQVDWYPSNALVTLRGLDESEFKAAEGKFEIEEGKVEVKSKFLSLLKVTTEDQLRKIDVNRINMETKRCREWEDGKGFDEYREALIECKKLVLEHEQEVQDIKNLHDFSNKKSNFESQKKAWEEKEKIIIEKANSRTAIMYKYRDAVLKPKTMEVKKKMDRAEVKRRDYFVSKGLAYVPPKEIKEHTLASEFKIVCGSFSGTQKKLNSFILGVRNSFKLLEGLDEEFKEKELKSNKQPIKVDCVELAKKIVRECAKSSKKTRGAKGKNRGGKKKNKKEGQEKKHIKRAMVIKGISKYFSQDFNMCCIESAKKIAGIPFNSDLRCRSIIELSKYLRKELLVDNVNKFKLDKNVPFLINQCFDPEENEKTEDPIKNIDFVARKQPI